MKFGLYFLLFVLHGVAQAQQVDYNTQILNKPIINVSAFSWSRKPGGSLIAGTDTVTLNPRPDGVAGTNTNHYLRLANGIGTAEVVLITGGTCTTSGTAACTIIFTPANYTHSGAWTIGTATAGIEESIKAICTAGGTVTLPAGTLNTYATITDDCPVSIVGQGKASIISPQFASGTVIDFNTVLDLHVTVANFQIIYNLSSYMTAGSKMMRFNNATDTQISNISMSGAAEGFHFRRAVRVHGSNLQVSAKYTCYRFDNEVLFTGGELYAGQFNDLYCAGDSTNTVGIIMRPTASGVIFTNFYFESIYFGVYIEPSALGPLNEIQFIGGIYDGCIAGCFTMAPGLGMNSMQILGGRMAAAVASTGPVVTIRGNGVKISDVVMYQAGASDLVVLDGATNTTVQNNSMMTSSAGSRFVLQGAVSGATITGNRYGFELTTPTNSVVSDGSAHNKIFFGNNNFNPASVFDSTLTIGQSNLIGPGQTGISIPTVASAATIAVPPYPIIYISGTTGVGAVSGLLLGQAGQFITTNGAVVFTAGATIGNTFTSTQNVPINWFYNGAKIYLK